MADEGGKPVRDTERAHVVDPEPLKGPMEVQAVSQKDLDRLREWERELAASGGRVAPASPGQSRRQDAGEEPASLMSLLLGGGLAAAGAYLLAQRVTIFGGSYYWARLGLGQNAFGLTLIPLLLGVGLLVYGKSALGWALTGLGALFIVLGILADMHMTFRPASLFEVILMLGMLAAGLGLIARSLRKA